ncbi:putative small integral membrane protein [Peribacillus simplex]
MAFLNWYDWIQPTTPYASIFFGVILTVLAGVIVWFNTKKIRTAILIIFGALSLTIIGTIILYIIGYYG